MYFSSAALRALSARFIVFTKDRKTTTMVRNAAELSKMKVAATSLAEPVLDMRMERLTKASRTATENPVTT